MPLVLIFNAPAEARLIVVAALRVVAPVTARVLDNVAAPVTASVPERDVLPVNVCVPVTD